MTGYQDNCPSNGWLVIFTLFKSMENHDNGVSFSDSACAGRSLWQPCHSIHAYPVSPGGSHRKMVPYWATRGKHKSTLIKIFPPELRPEQKRWNFINKEKNQNASYCVEMFVSQSQNFHWICFLMSNWLKIHIGSVVGLAPKIIIIIIIIMLHLYSANFKNGEKSPCSKALLNRKHLKRVTNNILIQYKSQWIEGYATLNR